MRLQPVQDPIPLPAGAARLDGSTSWLERQACRKVAHANNAGAVTSDRWFEDLGGTEGPALLHGIVQIVESLSELEIAYVDTGHPEVFSLKLPGLISAARGLRMGPTGQPHHFDGKRRQLAA
jgi:hypothetical protein